MVFFIPLKSSVHTLYFPFLGLLLHLCVLVMCTLSVAYCFDFVLTSYQKLNGGQDKY